MMNQKKSTSLIPFATPSQDIQIGCSIEWKNSDIKIQFDVTGRRTGEIVWPKISPSPSRKDDLWQTTCFEIFLSVPGSPEYLEFNFSPSRDWAAYQFHAYRKKQRDEHRLPSPHVRSHQELNHFVLTTEIVSEKLFLPTILELDCSCTAIIQLTNSNKLYFAHKHSGAVADFHLRDSFNYTLKKDHV